MATPKPLRKERQLVEPERPIIGFFLHQQCGDVAAWCTEYPKVREPLCAHDRDINGAPAILPSFTSGTATCISCGRIATLRIKYYRAIPRERDLRRTAQAQPRRAINLAAGRDER